KKYLWVGLIWTILLMQLSVAAQQPDKILTMTDAVNMASANYLIQSQINSVKSSAELGKAAKKDALPGFIVAAQNAYGTLNGVNGLSSGLPGIVTLSATSSISQNMNASFGSLYTANLNVNVFSFGLQRAHVAAALGQN